MYCPFCGAEPAGLLDFGCGTGTPSLVLHPDAEEPQWIRSNDCKDRQIAQLEKRLMAAENLHHQCCKDNARLHEKLQAAVLDINELKVKLAAWREVVKDRFYLLYLREDKTGAKLRELGEI